MSCQTDFLRHPVMMLFLKKYFLYNFQAFILLRFYNLIHLLPRFQFAYIIFWQEECSPHSQNTLWEWSVIWFILQSNTHGAAECRTEASGEQWTPPPPPLTFCLGSNNSTLKFQIITFFCLLPRCALGCGNDSHSSHTHTQRLASSTSILAESQRLFTCKRIFRGGKKNPSSYYF